MLETGISKNKIISELSRSPHGSLKDYVETGRIAATAQPEFFAHLIAWDAQKGQVRDSKVALPVVSLLNADLPSDFVENSLAHLMKLNPREFLRAYRYADALEARKREINSRLDALKTPGQRKSELLQERAEVDKKLKAVGA